MPKKIKFSGKLQKMIDVEQLPETDSILKNRIYRFKELLGEDSSEEQLASLVYSKVDYWDLDKLLKSGCEPDLAIKILL